MRKWLLKQNIIILSFPAFHPKRKFSCYQSSVFGVPALQQKRTSNKFSWRNNQFGQLRMGQSVAIVDNCIVNLNPATGEEISRVPCTPIQQLDEMVRRAKHVQKTSWRKVPANERIAMIRNGLSELARNSEQLAQLIVKEMGKPIAEARDEAKYAGSIDEYLEILAQSLEPRRYGSSVVVRQPLGVVTIFSPWNFPSGEILVLVIPALGSGNTVIVKPSEVVPETGAFVVNTLAAALPDGVLQLAQGDGSVGGYLAQHDGIDLIAMTGSSATGQKILHSASSKPKLKRFVLELGGKDPMIVFADADLDKAATDAVKYSLSNTGQVCCSFERIYVAESIYDEFQKLVTEEAQKYKVGNGIDSTVQVGPLVSRMQRDIVKEQVDDALQKGAKLLFQSNIPTGNNEASSFYPVTVLADVKDGMKLYRDETFGPVVSLTPFDGTEATAIELANDTVYGLGSSVYTTDIDKANRVAEAIDAGQVGINCYALDNMDVACPWVGHKNSGFGYHSGQEGFHNFSIPKTLAYSSPDNEDE